MSEKTKECATDSQGESTPTNLMGIEVAGINADLWTEKKSGFLRRMVNSAKNAINSEIPREETANDEILDIIDDLGGSLKALSKKPQYELLERKVSIIAKLAEIKSTEALTRKTQLENDKLELELAVKFEKWSESQEYIKRKIQRGELTIQEIDGEHVFIFK